MDYLKSAYPYKGWHRRSKFFWLPTFRHYGGAKFFRWGHWSYELWDVE